MRETESVRLGLVNEPLLKTELGGVEVFARGKVRDLYAAGPDALLFVASDRISAFDHVLGSGIPDKGRVLTQLSLFWFEYLKDVVKNHLMTADVALFPAEFKDYGEQLRGRSMLVRRAEMFPVECVMRGYISGSGWKDYKETGKVCGIDLPAGLHESDRLAEPLFTPAGKNNVGHDENISFDEMVTRIGGENAEKLRALTRKIYETAAKHAESKGLILADTKFEFGLVEGEIVLADEVLTPDSSRYWLKRGYLPGGPQPSYDKQFVRDYLESIRWDKQEPAPGLPEDVVAKTREKYVAAYEVLSGKRLEG